jgi:hypothetical protein
MRKQLAFSTLVTLFPLQALSQTAGGMSDITVLSVDIGHFDYGHKIIHVYENSRNQAENKDDPTKWQFVIEPLFSTVKNGDSISYKTINLGQVGSLPATEKTKKEGAPLQEKHRVLVPLELINDNARDQALGVVLQRYPQAKCKIGPSNIDVLPLVEATFKVQDVENGGFLSKNTFLRSQSEGFLTSPKQTYLYFDVFANASKGDSEIDQFIRFFPFLQIEANVSFSVKSTKFNISTITADKLKDSTLFVKLNGTGGVGTVSRNDLRNLVQEAVSHLKVFAIVEDPASFSQDLFNSIIASAQTVTADEAFFNTQLGKETYNADDLKPDVVTREINKLFEKDSGKDQWKFNSSAKANANVLNIIGGGFEGSLSGEQLKEWLKEHQVESDIQENKIIAKSIRLEQVNIGKFLSNFNFGMEYRNISGSSKQNLRTIIFGEPVPVPAVPAALSFNSIISDCKNSSSLLLQSLTRK